MGCIQLQKNYSNKSGLTKKKKKNVQYTVYDLCAHRKQYYKKAKFLNF